MKRKLSINIYIFLISMFIGFLFIKYVPDNKKDVTVYPTPDNYKDLQYKDLAGNCFQFDVKEMNCKNHNTKDIPIQS